MSHLHFLPVPFLLAVAGGMTAQPPKPAKAPADLAAVPRDGFAVATLKASAAWDLPALKQVRDWAAGQPAGTFDPLVGVGPADLDRVTLFWPTFDLSSADSPLVLTTTRKPYDKARVVRNIAGPGAETPARAGLVGSVLLRPRGQWVAFADDTTLVWNTGQAGVPAALVGQLVGRKGDGPLAPALAAAGDHLLAVGVGVSQLAGEPSVAAGLAKYAPLLAAESATLTADVTDDGKAAVALTLAFADVAGAKTAGPVLEQALADLSGRAGTAAERYAGMREAEAGVVVFGWLRDGLKGAKVEVTGTAVVATASAPLEPALTAFVATFPKRAHVSRGVTPAEHNLKQILLAAHNYASAFDHFPGDVVPDGKFPWSWRVMILPYLEHEDLYRRLDLTQAWNSPRNLEVLKAVAMPKEFEVPGRAAPMGLTYWRSFTSPADAEEADRAWLTAGRRGPGAGGQGVPRPRVGGGRGRGRGAVVCPGRLRLRPCQAGPPRSGPTS